MFEERTRPKPFAEETLREKLLYKGSQFILIITCPRQPHRESK